jgi:Transposase DDE domain
VAVQVVVKEHGEVVEVDHVGSAHTDAELALLLTAAADRLHPGQESLDLGSLPQPEVRLADVADWTDTSRDQIGAVAAGVEATEKRQVDGGGRVVRTSALTLWSVLEQAWTALEFDVVADEAFRAVVLARVVEPVSKADTPRVLDEVGVAGPSLRTIFRALGRCVAQDYRGLLAAACLRHCTRSGPLSLVLYDVTTLHFEVENEDKLRKVGMSKERRVDPQVQLGLLVDPSGFPLEVCCFEGNKAETKTLLPVLTAFTKRHHVRDMVVVADAGMLSAANLNAIEDAGFCFIVGSRISKAPYDLADHIQRRGNAFTDGQVLESSPVMGSGKAARKRRVVYQYLFARHKRDDRAINAMVDRAEAVAAGTRPLKKDRFVRIDATGKGVDWALVERARQIAGLKGYADAAIMPRSVGSLLVTLRCGAGSSA